MEKPHPNRRVYLATLRRMSPEERLSKAFELTDMTRELLRDGLRERFPDRSEADLQRLYIDRLTKCHNRRY